MIDSKETIVLIKEAIDELDNLSVKSRGYEKGREPYESTKKALDLLANEIIQNKETINIRTLRAMHDVGMSSYKEFENTKMADLIERIVSKLYRAIPLYKDLKPLRDDFGKGDPI